nr:MAG TPA: hypothetical protein [Bacteriophage sp.]
MSFSSGLAHISRFFGLSRRDCKQPARALRKHLKPINNQQQYAMGGRPKIRLPAHVF